MADPLSDALTKMTQAVDTIAKTATQSETNMRRTLAIFGAAVAMQPGIDAKKLLADFDRQLEANTGDDIPTPMVALDVRAALAKTVEGLSRKGK